MKKIYILFFLIFLFLPSVVLAQSLEKRKEAEAISSFDEIEAKGSYVDNISDATVTSLPIGLKSKNKNDNTTYTIGVTKAKFYPTYTELTVFAKVDIPQKGENGLPMSLFFGAENIKLSHDGGIIGDAKLALLGDVYIPMNKDSWGLTLYGGFNKATGEIEDLTYAKIDCNGFKELRISGAVDFSENLILPIHNGIIAEKGSKIPITLSNGRQVMAPNRVRGEFSFTATNWNDMLVEVSLDPFVLAKKQNSKDYEGNFQFLVNKAVLDLSDIKNSDSVIFPPVYRNNGLLFPNEETWRGIYIQTLEVGLPAEFKTTATANSNKRITLGASNLIIDKFGVSGTFYGDNVFPLNEGITDKSNAWAYSLDHISVTLERNDLKKANFAGEIVLPVTKFQEKNTEKNKYGFLYDGLISENEYSLTVATSNSIKFDVWKAKAVLAKNSSIQLRVKDSRFLPKANLHGTIDFSTSKNSKDEDTQELSEDKKTVDFKGLAFENLSLQTVSPMIEIGSMKYNDNIKFGNFPASIANIDVVAKDRRADLFFDLGINLMDKSEFKADARLGIRGELVSNGARQKYKYSGLDLSKIQVRAKFSGFDVFGRLDLMENDPVYGKGFNADLKVSMEGAFAVEAKAIFGKKDFRYWYFDAASKLETGYFINGFGGGAYYKMKRKAFVDPAEFSPTGLTYEPYADSGLGLKAMVSFSIGSEKAFNGEAALELNFNKHGGLDFAAIYGKGNVLADIPGLDNINNLVSKVNKSLESSAAFLNMKTNKDEKSSFENRFLPMAETAIPETPDDKTTISFKAAIQFDIANKTTHGTLDVRINAAFISGVGEGGKAGWAVFHKDPQDWYLYIGTPDNRIGVKIGVAGVYLKTDSYIMAGTKLPGSPPPPAHIARILGTNVQTLNYMRDENALANAGGFAFGTDLSIDTGDLTFLIFYANFKAGIGFDIMLKNYQEAQCSNTGEQIGINGWYANGQSYAYLQGELGVKVKLYFIKAKIPIISAGAAVLMQAKLPNPSWFRGYVGGYMNILGGLIKGKFNFKVTIGEQCEFAQGGVLDGMKMIMDVSPKDKTDNVDVFAVPQATFALKVNEPIEIPDDKGVSSTYKVILDKFTISGDNGQLIEGDLEWSNIKDRVNFVSKDILPPDKMFKILVQVSFQKLENGIYIPVTENGQIIKETEERTFTTGSAPDHIPLTNIEYSYPVVNQKFYLQDEYKKAYIKLKRGQDYLFEDGKWETKVKIHCEVDSKESESVFNYDPTGNEIYFDMSKLKNRESYRLIIYSKGKEGVVSKNTSISSSENNNESYTIAEKKAENLVREGEIERLKYDFRTSKYNLFDDKIKAIRVSNYNFIVQSTDVISLANNISESEPFEETDLIGNIYTGNKPLVDIEADLSDEYYQQDINPILYSKLPVSGKYTIKYRKIEELGLIPKKALSINSYYLNSVQNSINYNDISTYFPYEYDLAIYYKRDLIDVRGQIVNDLASGIITTSDSAYKFLDNNFKSMRHGEYKVNMKYTLPGTKHSSESQQFYKNRNN